jgi:hypothetical protein
MSIWPTAVTGVLTAVVGGGFALGGAYVGAIGPRKLASEEQQREDDAAKTALIGSARAWRDDFWEAEHRLHAWLSESFVPEGSIQRRVPAAGRTEQIVVGGAVTWKEWVSVSTAQRGIERLPEGIQYVTPDAAAISRYDIRKVITSLEVARGAFHRLEAEEYQREPIDTDEPFVVHPCYAGVMAILEQRR